MKPSIILITFSVGLVVSWSTFGQDINNVDSLKRLLIEKKGIERFDVLFELIREYGNSYKYEEALPYAKEAYQMAKLSGDSIKIVKSGRATGQIMARLELFKDSKAILNQILPVAYRNHLIDDLSIIYNSLGVTNTFLANYPEALKYLLQSLAIREKQSDKFALSVCFNNIGLIYYKLDDHAKALNYYLRSLSLKKEINTNHEIDALYINIGLCYTSLTEWDSARQNLAKGFEICKEQCSNVLVIGYFGYGRLAFEQEKFDSAEFYLMKSYQKAIEENDNRYQAENLVMLAQIELYRRNFLIAEAYLMESEEKALREGYKHVLVYIYDTFSQLYKEQKLYKKASTFQQKHIDYKDSVINEKLANKLAVIQVEVEQQQNAIAIAHNNEIIKQQRTQTALVSIIAVLLAGLAFALFKIIRSKQEVNNKLDHKVSERTHELELSREALQRSYTEQNIFFYKTAKEIQAPLASLKGIGKTLSLDNDGRDVLPYVSNIHMATEKLDRLVSNLTRINSNLITQSSLINVSAIVDAAIENMRVKDMHNKISHSINTNIMLRTDGELFQTLFDFIFQLDAPSFNINVSQELSAIVIKIKTGKKNTYSEYAPLFIQASKIASQLNMRLRIEKDINDLEEFHIVVRD
jgi:tetratricopeptide (TPR) repeat protein